jgi:nucleoside 2-deoxyribosyltransferase
VDSRDSSLRASRNEKIKVYVSIPISGRLKPDVDRHILTLRAKLHEYGYDVIAPKVAGEIRDDWPIPSDLREDNERIYDECRNNVLICDVLFCDLTGADAVSIGCVAELTWAREFGKWAAVAMLSDSPHRHAFVKVPAHKELSTRWEVFDYFRDYGLMEKRLAEWEAEKRRLEK